MSVLKSIVYDTSLQRQIAQGDVLAAAEVIPATNATQNITVTGQMLQTGFLVRSNGAAMVDTIDTAANLIAAMSAGVGGLGIQNGTSFRCQWIVTSAFTATLTAAANTGITVNRGIVNAASSKQFLVTIVNGTPAQTLAANTTNASAIITGMSLAQTSLLSTGMIVTSATAGTQGFSIISVQPGVGVTLSNTATSTNSQVAFTFSPVVQIDGISQGLI